MSTIERSPGAQVLYTLAQRYGSERCGFLGNLSSYVDNESDDAEFWTIANHGIGLAAMARNHPGDEIVIALVGVLDHVAGAAAAVHDSDGGIRHPNARHEMCMAREMARDLLELITEALVDAN